jgi:hypothetical protein
MKPASITSRPLRAGVFFGKIVRFSMKNGFGDHGGNAVYFGRPG